MPLSSAHTKIDAEGEAVGSVRAACRLGGIVLLMMHLCLAATGLALVFGVMSQRWQKHKVRWILLCMRYHLRWIGAVAGLRIRCKSSIPWPQEPFLLLANHVSYWDIIALAGLHPMVFVAKSEIASWPLVGFLISQCQTLYVERTTVQGRFRALLELRRRLEHASVCIFPEGTTTARTTPSWSQWYRGQIAVLKKPGVRVFTLALVYENQQQCAWIDDDALLPHLWRCLKQKQIELSYSLKELALRPRVHDPLGPFARLAFEQTVELCGQLSADAVIEPRILALADAKIPKLSPLTEK